MIILDNTKTLIQLASDSTNGLGQISPLSCTVTEVLNGEYEAEFTLNANDKYFSLLSVGSLVKIQLDAVRGEQIFEIYFISKPINEIVSIKCQHITYRLNKVPVGVFSSTGAVSTVNNLLSHVIGSNEFTMATDITNTTSNFTLDIPRYFRECLGGYEGSMLDVFRGEYEWDNLTVRMLAHRGSDEGVRIAYGKNLTDFKQEENNQEVYTSILGYAVVDDVTYTGNVYDKVVSNNRRVKIVDFSSDYQSGQVPTVSELTGKAEDYAERNDIESPNINISISFVPLYQTEEYKNIAPLERVNLGDTVHVYFEKLGVEASSRVVKTVWNVLTQKYDSIELGSVKANLNTVLNESMQEVKEDIISSVDLDTGFVEAELTELGDLVVNGLGLFITKNVLIDGSERIVLHNKLALIDSDVQYYISANGLVVSTDYGQTWNAGFNPDGSAVLNALSANIIRALQIYGSFLRFGDVTSNYIDVAPYSVNNVPQGVSFDGTGMIRMRPQGQFNIQNYKNGNIYNQLLLTQDDSTGNQFYIANNDNDVHVANYIRLAAHRVFNSTYGETNYFAAQNYCYDDPSFTANYFNFLSTSPDHDTYPSNNRMFIYNKKYGVSDTGNDIQLTSTPTEASLGMYNYNYGQSITANYMTLRSMASGNTINIFNKAYNVDLLANTFIVASTPTENRISLSNNIYGSTNPGNTIQLLTTSGGGRTIYIDNYDPGSQLANQVLLSYQSGIAIRAYQDDINIECYNGNIYINSHKLTFSNGNVGYQ